MVGRGRLIADCTTQEFIERSAHKSVLVESPDLRRLVGLGAAAIEVEELTVTGMPADRIGHLAANAGLELHELTPQSATLEEAFMELTRGSLEYPHARRRPATPPRRGDHGMTSATAGLLRIT